MTSLTARIGRISPLLTARERAALTIRSELGGEDPDPALRRLMPRDQVTEFNRLIALYYIANSELGTLVFGLRLQAMCLVSTVDTARVLKEAAATLATDIGEQVPDGDFRKWRKRPEVTVPQFLIGLGQEVADDLRKVAVVRFQELRAIEVVWEEVSEQIGEDCVHADQRTNAEETRRLLLPLLQQTGKAPRPPEPTSEQLDQFRLVVEHVLRTFHLLEVP